MSRTELEGYLRAHKNDLEDKLFAYLRELGIPETALSPPHNYTREGRVKILEMSVREAFGGHVLLEITYRWSEAESGGLKAVAGPDTFAMRWVDGALEFGAVSPDAGAATAVESLDGTWVASDGVWTAELTITGRDFRLEAFCETEGRLAGGVGTGTLDASGRVPTTILSGGKAANSATAEGTIGQFTIAVSRNWACPQATLAFRRLGDAGSWDGKWSGQANLVKETMANTMGPACASRLKLDLQISGSTVTGFVKGMPAWFNGLLSGVIDASGNLEGQGRSSGRGPLTLHGSLSADTGAGSGVWSSPYCEGTFEIARVE
jgi:hypothetical protein